MNKPFIVSSVCGHWVTVAKSHASVKAGQFFRIEQITWQDYYEHKADGFARVNGGGYID